ncbi:putative protein OS=Tsukamurella paurometabola (strain ATCC 8368 / DSM / CCUG 35730 /CIP 100753 / JCM 10117 / KCTC 9821 / NBRC 16120 / NCIMB 702349/ NCTC 13040) OX=521096 GN=Tpau_1621 PE=4 SV=1 [Tsukamurella paurometabola]|uniref:Uncharacterized protein n=1 Tax=Tsukamurella paurometabola (strain ATCC 8368 / DSM 20162 / CCUG 35730 / CIP 100753 / JCM 10117 / KCTC 9821 / NBRC 16120 / NCIMB 702349 / NCTC 13040) TaxID=521096 RepID=D5UYD5_TSUPD|nr:hypothetical protein [Tsukamurella paurometabola]ADG78242.1 hypothetical protein Tpau_1621 [Tsukamurella paurometabola DSM 20162]SUP30836.1 Uncharacterised protein [Tsukamurella paurometabola]
MNASTIRRTAATIGMLALGGTALGVGAASAAPAAPAPTQDAGCVLITDPAAPEDYSKATCTPVSIDKDGNLRDATGKIYGKASDAVAAPDADTRGR